jgi:hypothetical protein
MKKKQDPIHKLVVGKQRENQVSQGFFDGRFVQRSEESKKVYKRKTKHKEGEDDN